MKHNLILLLLALACWNPVMSQEAAPRHFLYLDDWAYELVDYWINSGALDHRFVLNQPFILAQIKGGLSIQDEWTRRVSTYFDEYYGTNEGGKLILYGRDNISLVSNGDLPLRKGEQAAPVDDLILFDNRSKNHYNFVAQFNLALPHLSLVNRTAINSEFLDDPLYPGDTGEWIYGRLEDAYMNANFGGFDFFFGRTDRNWGPLSSPSLILSNNPYSYDHAQFSYTSKKIKFSMLIARLEDMLGQDIQGAFPDSLLDSRRYLSAHRLDVSLSQGFQFAVTEVALYGGPDRDLEFGLLNPMGYFYLVQRNDRKELNGVWALDVFWKPRPRWNLFVQFLLDDFIVNNEPGQDDRAQYPDRLGIHFRVSQADAWQRGLQTGIEVTRIGNRTYQSFRTWENFHYHGKGLGYPAASIERVALMARYFRLFPTILKFKASYQRAGGVKLTDVFTGAKDDRFPAGVVEKTWQLDLGIRYVVQPWSQITATVGYERISNYLHVPGDNRSNLKFILGISVNLALAYGF